MYKKIELIFDDVCFIEHTLGAYSDFFLDKEFSFHINSSNNLIIENRMSETLITLATTKDNEKLKQLLHYKIAPITIEVYVSEYYLMDEVKMEDPALKKTQMIEVRNKVFYCITPEFRRIYTDVIMEELLKDNCLRDHIEKNTLYKISAYFPADDNQFLTFTLCENNPYLNKIMEKFNADFIIVEDIGGQLYTYKREGLKL